MSAVATTEPVFVLTGSIPCGLLPEILRTSLSLPVSGAQDGQVNYTS